jgi:hypothetical protein
MVQDILVKGENLDFFLGSVDILGHVILSDHRERRISLVVINSGINPEILRRSAPQNDMFMKCQHTLENLERNQP